MGVVVPLQDRLYREPQGRGLDHAKPDGEGLPLATLERWHQEIADQPRWRGECDKDADYYDGHQLTGEILEAMRAKGFPAIKENLVQPTVDVVLGMEAKSRTDWVVRPDHDRWEEVAKAESVKLKEAEREAGADRAVSDAFAAMVKAGAAWVEVSRESIPIYYPYRVRYVHRREIDFDWRFKEPDGRDMRYLRRRQWFDRDQIMAMFPRHKKLLELIGNELAWWDYMRDFSDTGLASSYSVARTTTIDQLEYMDLLRDRLCLCELWYRVWHDAHWVKLPDGRTVQYDPTNKEMKIAVAHRWLMPFRAPAPKVRLSYWIGPHRLDDIPSPYQHVHFPYVFFFGKREDRSGAPYGMIRNMRDQQDEVNARKAKMMWLLSAKRVRADGDAVKDHNVAKDEVSRPDAYIILNENRKPNSKFEVDDQLDLSEQQFKVYESAKTSLQDVAGVYQALLGKEGSAESGVAINQLIEQGSTTLAELMDNHRTARRQVGVLLLELVKEDITNGETVTVGEGNQRREVTLNEEAEDEFGPTLKNDVRKASTKVALDDIPSTPTYRRQIFQQLTEITKSLPEDMQALIMDFIIEATDLPNRAPIAERIRAHLGVNSGKVPTTPAEKKAAEAAAAEQMRKASLARRAEEAEVRGLELDNEDKAADIDQKRKADEGIDPELLKEIEAQVTEIIEEAQAEIQRLNKELQKAQQELAQRTDAEMKAGADVRKAEIDAGAKERIARINAESNERIAALEKQKADVVNKLKKSIDELGLRHKELAGKVKTKADKKPAAAKPAPKKKG